MSKVLISPIGVGPHNEEDRSEREYRQAQYRFGEDGKTYETPFFTAALAEHLKMDKVIFIGTARSMWEEVYRYFTQKTGLNLDYDYWTKLGDLTEESEYNNRLIDTEDLVQSMLSVDKYLKSINSNATGGSQALIIDYGINEEELWKNFGEIMGLIDTLDDGDELYLDITHAFRSIPLFLYLMMEFLQVLDHKRITLKGLYYGMLDATKDLGYTPVVDLSPLYHISKWIRGAHDFINFGDGYLISSLIDNNNNTRDVSQLSRRIRNVSKLVNINYLTDLQGQIQGIKKLLDREYQDIEPIKYIMPLISDFVNRFGDGEKASDFQLELSKWYFENRRYGHGYICLVEAVLTRLCEVYELNLRNIKDREKIKQLVVNRKYQRSNPNLERLADKYNSINAIRNRIAHASFYQGQNYSFTTDISQAMKNYEDIKNLLENEDIDNLPQIICLDSIAGKVKA